MLEREGQEEVSFPSIDLEFSQEVLPNEAVLQALVDGEATLEQFVDSQELEKLAVHLGPYFSSENDTDGIPLFLEPPVFQRSDGSSYVSKHAVVISGEPAVILQKIAEVYVGLVMQAGQFEREPEVLFEAIRYTDEGMDWHYDNYDLNHELSFEESETDGTRIEKLNGVLTLSGTADYSYQDPETKKPVTFPVGPGTLVITRSGDVDDLPQVRHKVGAPKPNRDGVVQPRVALLIALAA